MSTAIETPNQTRTVSEEDLRQIRPKIEDCAARPLCHRRLSPMTTASSRPAIPAAIRWSQSAAAASALRMWTAMSSSTSPPASPSPRPATVTPKWSKPFRTQAAELIHMSGTDFYYDHMTKLAERLSAIAPMPGPHRFYYGNSGAEAVECA